MVGVVHRLVLIAAVLVGLAAGVAAPARAHTQVLMPGVTYSRQVQFTAHGPVVINVITAPKPGGLYSLKPVLANGTVTGRQRVTAMQKAISDTTTVAGVNGDLFNWKDGHPSGIVMQDGVIKSPPIRTRSSVGISSTGTLSVARVALYGYWQGLGSRRPVTGEQDSEGRRHVALHARLGREDAGRGRARSRPCSSRSRPRRAAASSTGTVIAQANGGGTPIPPTAPCCWPSARRRRSSPPRRRRERRFTMQLVLTPDWPAAGIADALGGGPVIVRNGKAVYTAGEDFLPSQLAPRDPRTGVGQRKDGKIVHGRRRRAAPRLQRRASRTSSSPRRSSGSAPSPARRSTPAARPRWRSTASC